MEDTIESLSNDIERLVEDISEKDKIRGRLDEAVQAKTGTRDAV